MSTSSPPTNSPSLPDPSYHKWPPTASQEYMTARRALLESEYALSQQIEKVAAQRRTLPPGPILPTYIFSEGDFDLVSNSAAKSVTLAELARQGGTSSNSSSNGGGKGYKPLVVYHMMMGEEDTVACPACSMFVDGLNGVAKHLAQRINLLIVAKAPLPAIRAYAKKRHWNDVRFLSSSGNSFNEDMGVEKPAWMQDMPQGPGISVFVYEDEGKGCAGGGSGVGGGSMVGGDGGGMAGRKGASDEDGVVRFWYQTTPHFRQKDGPVIRGMDLLTPVWNMLDITPAGRGEWDAGLDYVEEWDGVTF